MTTPTNSTGPGEHPQALPPLAGIPGADRTTVVEAEAALLGAAMLYPATAAQVLDDIGGTDLTDPIHRVILTAIRTLLAEGVRPDGVLVAAVYARHSPGPLPPGGFAARIHDCLQAAALPVTAHAYRRAVIETRWRRDALITAERIAQAARDFPLRDLHEVLSHELTALARTLARLAPPPTAATPTAPALRDVA